MVSRRSLHSRKKHSTHSRRLSRRVTFQQAYTILGEEIDLNKTAAEDLIERLHMRGHLYEVDGEF